VAVDRFQDPTSKTRVFLGQTEAAGVGLNLTAASHVVFAEGSWVPSTLEQAADRAHRIGTKKNVTADLLTISGSIDEHMLRRALEKRKVVDQIMPQNEPFTPGGRRARILYS
jgi:SWI/SNF-related matrix-associated actin-dependent regulator 1 of chromatin subfamily A